MARKYYSRYRRRSKSSHLLSDTVTFFVLAVMGLIAAGLYFLTGSFENLAKVLWIAVTLFSLFAGGIVVWILWRQHRLSRALNLSQIDQLDGIAFEQYLAHLLKSRGFVNVSTTVAEGDYGADLLGVYEGTKYAVQAKRYATYKVGVDAIYQVLGGKEYYGCEHTMVITTSYFTNQAKQLAKKSGTQLIDRTQLAAWILEFQSS